MFENKNKQNIDAIKAELEGIKEDIEGILENNSTLGTGVNSLLDDINKRIAKAEACLDSISVSWASKNDQLKELKTTTREIRMLFSSLGKDIYNKIENANAKGKKYQVPSKRVKETRDSWVGFVNKFKEKLKDAEEKREKIASRKKIWSDIFSSLGHDAKEDAIVNEQAEEAKQRAEIVMMLAREFGVDPSDIRGWPDDMLLSSAEQIMRRKRSKKESGEPGDQNGQGPSFE